MGLIAAVTAISVLFAASPFLLPEFMREFGVSVAAAGRYSAVLVASFAVASLGAGRFLQPSRMLLVGCNLAMVVTLVASALVPTYGLLLAVAAAIGLAAGLINWIAWREAVHLPSTMTRVAAAGPLAGILAALVLGPTMASIGRFGAYLLMAGLSLICVFVPTTVTPSRIEATSGGKSRSNLVLLGLVTLMSVCVSTVWVYVGVRLDRLDASPLVLTLALTVHSAIAILSARIRARRVWPWFLAMALAVCLATVPPVIWLVTAGVLLWGAVFWPAVTGVLRLIEERSAQPGEQTGNFQGLMAVGRIVGPLLGGGLEASGGFLLMGVVATSGLIGSAAGVGAVERYRAGH